MDLLKSYSSDESEDDEKTELDSDSHEIIDYFNLNSSDSDEDRIATNKSGGIIDNYSVFETSNILSENIYGPNRPKNQDNHIQHKPKTQKADVMLKMPDFGGPTFPNKRYKSMKYVQEQTLSTNDGTNEPLNICSRSDPIENKKVNDQNISRPPETEIFKKRDKISYYLSEEKCSNIPRNAKSFHIHNSSITSLKWCKAEYSHLLLTSSTDSTVKIWDSDLTQTVAEYEDRIAVKAAKWSLCGTKVIYGGYGKKAIIVDVQTGKKIVSSDFEHNVTSLEVHPRLESVFLVGTMNNIFAFDIRDSASTPIKRYSSKCQDVLDIAFFDDGSEFVCSTEVVSRDCADRTLMVWDFATSAIMSNQIYALFFFISKECYTCPCVRVEPGGQHFIAQSNGDYIAMFKTKRPFRRRNRRYHGHKVSGYNVTCDFSPDGKYIASGDAGGGLFVYFNESCSLARKLTVKADIPTVQVSWHPVLNSTLATGSLDGSLQIWQ